MLLELDGKLALSDDVRKYVPELPDYGGTITLGHLLHHTSGLRDYNALLSLAGIDEQDVSTDEQALALIARQRGLNFPTGARYEYSNTGYFLLSVIVRRVSGKSLAQFARERMFLPLGMAHAQFRDRHDMIIPDRALGYASAPGEVGTEQSGEPDGELRNALSNWEQTGDGSLHLSVEDALKWNENFQEPRLAGRAFAERLQQTGTLANGETIAYARGLSIDRYRGLLRVQHGGNWIGYNAMLARFPEQRTAIAVFCNFEGAQAALLSNQVADIVLDGQLRPPGTAAAAKPGRSRKSIPHARIVGRYFATDSETIFGVTEQQGTLMLEIGSQLLPLAAVGPARFAVQGYPVTVEFQVDGSGPAQALRLQVDDDPPTIAQRFVPVTPDAKGLRVYAGTFYSPELDVAWPIDLDGERLVVRREKRKFVAAAEPLEPAMRDAFVAEAGVIRFARESSGRITGFDLSSSRMRGIHFELRPSGQ